MRADDQGLTQSETSATPPPVAEEDALSWLGTLAPESIALFVTDPPYGINTKSDGKRKLNPWADLCNAAVFYAQWLDHVRRTLRRDGAAWLCSSWRTFTTMQRASCLLHWPIESCLVWDKKHIGPGGMRGLRPRYELVLLFAMPDFQIPNRGLPDIIEVPRPTGKGALGHPAEKPRALGQFLLETSGVAGLVADPFAGSGNFLAAAAERGHPVTGCEIDPHWCQVANAQIAAAQRVTRTPTQQMDLTYGPPTSLVFPTEPDPS